MSLKNSIQFSNALFFSTFQFFTTTETCTMKGNLRFHGLLISAICCVVAAFPYIFDFTFCNDGCGEEVSSVNRLHVYACSVAITSISFFMVFDCILDLFGAFINYEILFPRMLVAIGFFISGILFCSNESASAERKVVVIVASSYIRSISISGCVIFHILGDYQLEATISNSWKMTSFVFTHVMLLMYAFTPFVKSRLMYILNNISLVLSCLIFLYFIIWGTLHLGYCRRRTSYPSTGIAKYAVIYFALIFSYFVAMAIVTSYFGRKTWCDSSEAELISYNAVDIATMCIIQTVPSRITVFDATITKVCYHISIISCVYR